MVTVIALVLAVVAVLALVLMVRAAFSGCFMAQWWLCWGGAGQLCEFIGLCVSAVISGLVGGE